MNIVELIKHIFKKHTQEALAVLFIVIFATTLHIFASDTPGSGGFYAGETLNPSCAPGSANCTVAPLNVGNSNIANSVGNNTLLFTNSTGKLSNDAKLLWNGTTLKITDGNTPADSLITSDYAIISAQDTSPTFSIISVDNTGNFDSRGVFKAVRARGTLASPTVPLTDDTTFSLLGAIFDGVDTEGTAAISFSVDGVVSSNVAPQRISFITSKTTAAARTEKMTIKANGNVGIGITAPLANLHIYNADATLGTGTISSTSGTTVNGSSTAFTTELKVGDIIIASSQYRTVATITSDILLTTNSAFNPTVSGAFNYQKSAIRIDGLPLGAPSGTNAGTVCVDSTGILWTDSGTTPNNCIQGD